MAAENVHVYIAGGVSTPSEIVCYGGPRKRTTISSSTLFVDIFLSALCFFLLVVFLLHALFTVHRSRIGANLSGQTFSDHFLCPCLVHDCGILTADSAVCC